MPPGVKRTPLSESHDTAASRSSTHRPTWLSGGSLHEVDLDLEGAVTGRRDVLVDVLTLALEVAGHGQTEHLHP